MRPDHDDDRIDSPNEHVRRLLAGAVQPVPLDEQRIQATLRQAAARLQTRRLVRRGLLATVAASLVVLVAAGYWRWSGADSELGLSYGTAIEVTANPGDYEQGRVQAAAGRVCRDIRKVVRSLQAQHRFPPALRDAVLQCMDSQQRIPVTYRGGFEELLHTVKSGQVLTPAQTTELTQTLCAGISAIRYVAEANPTRVRLVQSMFKNLRELLLAAPPPAADSAPK